ncbi:hypothetical protein K504DRAFT_498035 [Pleomassaria siparia CBS 279.74]|uniref:Uncharacterized protein n=1 Tax=Pleomassaria siparia CBS 279.74 TaxID=1314801 RepID=A0A6G1KK58_9PLEO|nr:hypothetical protein K504DRAFT_498035 [Pleomassaria siparia CBS 279.74]
MFNLTIMAMNKAVDTNEMDTEPVNHTRNPRSLPVRTGNARVVIIALSVVVAILFFLGLVVYTIWKKCGGNKKGKTPAEQGPAPPTFLENHLVTLSSWKRSVSDEEKGEASVGQKPAKPGFLGRQVAAFRARLKGPAPPVEVTAASIRASLAANPLPPHTLKNAHGRSVAHFANFNANNVPRVYKPVKPASRTGHDKWLPQTVAGNSAYQPGNPYDHPANHRY